MTTILAALADLEAVFHHLTPWWQFASLVVVAGAGTVIGLVGCEVFGVVVTKAWLAMREERIPEPEVRVAREAYCRVCRCYPITTETYCEHCLTPLLLFADAIDMAAHMARTFPLPAVATFKGSAHKGFKGDVYRDEQIGKLIQMQRGKVS